MRVSIAGVGVRGDGEELLFSSKNSVRDWTGDGVLDSNIFLKERLNLT